MRWTTWVDRKLAGWQRHEPVPAPYRRPAARGFTPYLKTLGSDPQTWNGLTNVGLFTVDTFGKAAIMTAIGLVLILPVLVGARWLAATHAALAVRLLGPAPAAATAWGMP